MEKFYVRSYYLKASHFFFYSLSIFAMIFAITFWQESVTHSAILIVSFIVYINASLWIAYFYYRDYEEHIKDVSVLKLYVRPYAVLSASVIFMTAVLMTFAPSISGLLYSVLFINYYYIFIVIIGGAMCAIKPVRRLFEFRRNFAISKGKEIAERYSHLSDIKEYKIGSSPLIDEMLDDIYVNKEYPTPNVKKLEMEICQRKINNIETKIETAKAENKNPKIIRILELEREGYEKHIEQTSKYED